MIRDLKRWLSEIGFGSRTELFATHDIDWDVLGDLNNEDLKDLGLSLGERKRLLKAIANLNAPTPTSLGGDLQTKQSLNAKGEAERRQITVMFIDVVDSTPLAERLDPEELREVFRIFHAECGGAIEIEEGHIARYLGDGVLVYFGYPLAHEDDAARAVRAGLRIIEKLQAANGRLQQKHGVQLRTRIGIQTGLVVVGEVGAGTALDPEAIVGETPNLAARLQGEAQPDTVVIGESTQRLIEDLFAFEDMGSHRLKGVSDPVRIWRVLREVAAVDRFDVRIRRGLTPLIGRAAELEMLKQRWTQARDGEMRCVLVAGEAGIGKSRLMRAFRDGLAGYPHETITLYCSPYHTNSAFAPLIDWLCRALHLNPNDPAGSIATLGAAADRLGLDGPYTMPVLVTLLGLPAIGEDQPAETTTTLFQRRVIETMAAVIAGLARQQPVFMLVEDAHWIDPSTHELLRELLEQLTTLQLLLLITARPEFKPGWSYPQVVQLNLDRLSRRDRIAMVERVAGGKKLPDFVLEQIATKTDGVPLFVEELTKTVLEGDVLRGARDRKEPSVAFERIAIPDTLQGLLLARLDRLPVEAKEIAQISAAIGREFSRDLLALVAGRPGNVLDHALDQLVAAEILQPAPRSTWGQGAHTFRHALIQEAAYSSLLLSRRRQFHAAIADALSDSFPELAAMSPELVAQHLTAADLVDRAIDAWLRAGDIAKRRGAFLEALAHLERGTELVQRLPHHERAKPTVSLLVSRAAVDTQLANPRAVSTLRNAAEIARANGLTAEFMGVALGFADAELWNNTPTTESVDLLEEALTAVGPAATVERSRILSRLSRSLLYVGAVDRAQTVMREANALMRRLGDVQSERELLWCEMMPNGAPPALAGQFGERRRLLQRLQQLAELDSDYNYMVNGIALTAPAFLELGDVDEFERIVHRYERLGTVRQSRVDRWSVTTMQAMGAILKGEFLSAERLATEAMELGDDSNFNIPDGIYGLQMFTIRREQGRLRDVAPLLKRFVDENPEGAVWRPGLMLIASDLGFAEQARTAFNAMAATGFAFPFDSKRTATLSYLTEVCHRLDDRTNAERLYELLHPYRDLAVVVGQGTICCGAVARFLGLLATTLRDGAMAETHFEAALAMDERMKGWPWLAHARFDYSRALLTRGRKKDAIRIRELRDMALAAAERLGMGGLSQRIANELPG